jgi:hypothetical protein
VSLPVTSNEARRGPSPDRRFLSDPAAMSRLREAVDPNAINAAKFAFFAMTLVEIHRDVQRFHFAFEWLIAQT